MYLPVRQAFLLATAQGIRLVDLDHRSLRVDLQALVNQKFDERSVFLPATQDVIPSVFDDEEILGWNCWPETSPNLF